MRNCSVIDRHLLAGYWINSNLTDKKQLILVADDEVDDPWVFREELTLLGNDDLERSEIKRLKIDFGIGKIRWSPSDSKGGLR